MNISFPFEAILLTIIFAASIVGIVSKKIEAYVVVFFGLCITVIYLLGERYNHDSWWGFISVMATALFARHMAKNLAIKNT